MPYDLGPIPRRFKPATGPTESTETWIVPYNWPLEGDAICGELLSGDWRPKLADDDPRRYSQHTHHKKNVYVHSKYITQNLRPLLYDCQSRSCFIPFHMQNLYSKFLPLNVLFAKLLYSVVSFCFAILLKYKFCLWKEFKLPDSFLQLSGINDIISALCTIAL